MVGDIFTLDENNNAAIRTLGVNPGLSETNSPSVFTEDEDGNACIRVTGGGGDQHNLGYYATQSDLETAYPTAEAGDWAIVGSTDTVWIWDDTTSAWVDSDQKGQVTSVNGKTGVVVLTPSDIGATSMSVPTTMPTLAVADWAGNAQTVTVSGVTATNTVIVSPAPASAVEYASCEILCTTQGTDSLTFSCQTTPTNNLTVNVVILS